MTYETRKAYSEIHTVLKHMPVEYISKIPVKILKLFEKEKIDYYEVKINNDNPLDKTYLSRKTIVLISILNYQYWYPNKKVKDELYKTYLSNNEIYQKQLEEKYNTENLFDNKAQKNIINDNTMEMIEYKESFFKKTINKLKRFFYRKK